MLAAPLLGAVVLVDSASQVLSMCADLVLGGLLYAVLVVGRKG
jgi:hypothetical protein